MIASRRASVALVLAAAALALAVIVASAGGSSDGGAVAPSVSPSPSVADPIRVSFSEQFEPFDYRDAPPLARTSIDGYYVRIVTIAALGGAEVGMPMHCRRCVPFEIDPGIETLTLYRGRYFIEHQLTGRRGLGHYTVSGRRVRFFNDPNCSRTVGRYAWMTNGSHLTFEALADPCPFGTAPDDLDHRARDLTFTPWIRIRPCTAQIRSWWPALFDCA